MKKYVFMFLLSLTSMVSMARDSIVTAQQRCQIEARDKAELLVPLTPSYLDGITSTTGWDNNWFVEAKGGTSAFIGTPIGRVFKIHKKNLHEIGKVLVCLKQLIFNIKSSKITV